MAYIFKQKLQISDLANLERPLFRVLIYEPEEYLGGLYEHYMKNHNFDIRHCVSLHEINYCLQSFEPELLVYNTDSDKDFSRGRMVFKNYPSLKIITTAYNISHEDARGLMALGVLSHINRRFSRPSDLATLAKTLLEN
jgi:hypothetical protein